MSKEKDKFYFSHDSNARRDPKMIALMAKHGYAGYGRFFAIVEMLRESTEYRLDISKAYVRASIADELKFSTEESEEFIKDCIEFELLEDDGIFVWSNSLKERMAKFEERKEHFRNLANKRWNKNGEKKNENKPSKSDEETKKDTKSKPFASIEAIRSDEIFEQIIQEVKDKDPYSRLSREQMENQRQLMLSWMESKGKRYKDYKAAYLGWLRRYITDRGIQGTGKEDKMVY